MKKFTHILTILLSIAAFQSTSHASEKMRDMSLSVQDTNRQFANPQRSRSPNDPGFYNDNNRNGNGNGNYNYDDYEYNNGSYNNGYNFDADTPIGANIGNQLDNLSQNNNDRRLPPPIRGMNQRGFINKFCSADYTPRNASSEAQQSCMDTQRQEACDRFQHAAVNIQRLLSQAIDCDANSSGSADSDCDGLDASRLDLLKQYWQDEDTSYTILYLPDMVLNSAANCTANSRRNNAMR
jgi:hypothetical protein